MSCLFFCQDLTPDPYFPDPYFPRSKEAADRDKDRAVLSLLRDIAASRKKLRIRR